MDKLALPVELGRFYIPKPDADETYLGWYGLYRGEHVKTIEFESELGGFMIFIKDCNGVRVFLPTERFLEFYERCDEKGCLEDV